MSFKVLVQVLMNRRLLCLAVVAVSGVFFSSGCGAAHWHLDPKSARDAAQKEQKLLLVYFKAWDSSQHRNFKLNVLSAAEVDSELKDTVNAELAFGFFRKQEKACGVTQAHVCVLCTPEGKPVGKPFWVNITPSKEEFLNWLRLTKSAAKATIPGAKRPP